MSQIIRAANFAREMDEDDIRVLQAIEWGMRRFQFVPVEQVKFFARIDQSEAQYRLDKLHKNGLLQRNSQKGYVGYQLISESYDILALRWLVERDVIGSIGDPIGRGKESDVFLARTPENEEVCVKIHRIGQTSFRQVRRLRNYIKNRRHISWLYVSRLSAEREYAGLERVQNLPINSPKPIGQNRHIVVMGLIDGVELSQHPPIDDPDKIMQDLLRQVEILFTEGNLIHCDLCEYNILYTRKESIRIIDFPQWEPTDHPNALSYMARDLENIANFFQKAYNSTFDVDIILDKLFGKDRAHLEEVNYNKL